MKSDESPIHTSKSEIEQAMSSSSCAQSLKSSGSFVVDSVIVLRMLLEIDGIEGVTALSIHVGIYGV